MIFKSSDYLYSCLMFVINIISVFKIGDKLYFLMAIYMTFMDLFHEILHSKNEQEI